MDLEFKGTKENKFTISDVANGNIIIDMRGSDNWLNKVNRLRDVLKKAAPKTGKEPRYVFAPFYYCKNGHWYESHWRESKSVPILEIID